MEPKLITYLDVVFRRTVDIQVGKIHLADCRMQTISDSVLKYCQYDPCAFK